MCVNVWKPRQRLWCENQQKTTKSVEKQANVCKYMKATAASLIRKSIKNNQIDWKTKQMCVNVWKPRQRLWCENQQKTNKSVEKQSKCV